MLTVGCLRIHPGFTQDSVDDYLDFCAERSEDLEKPYPGKFKEDSIVKHIKWLWSTIPIAILLFIAAGSGVLWGKSIYVNVQPFIVAQAFGQDIVSFCLVLPGLIISALFARKGSNRSLLIWSGLLAYDI